MTFSLIIIAVLAQPGTGEWILASDTVPANTRQVRICGSRLFDPDRMFVGVGHYEIEKRRWVYDTLTVKVVEWHELAPISPFAPPRKLRKKVTHDARSDSHGRDGDSVLRHKLRDPAPARHGHGLAAHCDLPRSSPVHANLGDRAILRPTSSPVPPRLVPGAERPPATGWMRIVSNGPFDCGLLIHDGPEMALAVIAASIDESHGRSLLQDVFDHPNTQYELGSPSYIISTILNQMGREWVNNVLAQIDK